MRVLDGDRVLMRIFIGEKDQYEKKPLYRALLEMFRREGIAGATVLRGIGGYGAKSHMHDASVLRLSMDLPIVVEVVDTEQHIEGILDKLDDVVREGLVTLEKARVVRYAPR